MTAFDVRIPRVLETPRRSMQRLGMLKLLVSISTRQPVSTLPSIGEELIRWLGTKVSLHWDKEIASYIRSALPEQTFASTRRLASRVLAGEYVEPPEIAVELQDAYLSRGDLPSRRGRLTPADSSRFPHWGVALGLTRKEPFGPLVRGNLLLALVNEAELSAFGQLGSSHNPLELTRPQRLFFLYVLLEKDLSVLAPLYEDLLFCDGFFSDLQAGDMLPDIFERASRALRNTGRGGYEADRANQLADTASAIRARKGKSYGKTVREQTVTPRLEPFVDIGVLIKSDPYSYTYEFTPSGREFFSCVKSMLQDPPYLHGFGRAAAAFLGYGQRQVLADSELLHLLYTAWDKLKSDLGYSPINETLLLGLIHGLEQGVGWFELDEALDRLLRAQKEKSGLLRFNIDRQGNLSVVRFLRIP